jgi:hypothetical protein
VNALSIIVVWALYPETNQRTLEEMDLVFACDSIWNWEAEKNFALLKEEHPELVQAAKRGNSVSVSVKDPETGASPRSRRTSLASTARGRGSFAVGRRPSNPERASGKFVEKDVMEQK